jgi:hypothetical protein
VRAVDSGRYAGDISRVSREEELKERAERRFEEARAAAGARDPREFYRQRLRELRARDHAAFAEAVRHYEKVLMPAVAEPDSDPIGEWLEYGRVLASLTAAGETVQIDPSGRAAPYARPVPNDHLVLHMPGSARETGIPVGLPPELSPAQRAAYALLVERRTS